MKLSEIFAKPIKLIGGGLLNLKGFSKSVINKEIVTDKEKELQQELDEALDKLSVRYFIDSASNPDINFCISKNNKLLQFTKDICNIYYPFDNVLLGEEQFDIMIFSAQSDGIVCYCNSEQMTLNALFNDEIGYDAVNEHFSYSDVDDNINSVSSAINYFVKGGRPILYIETNNNIMPGDGITEMLETLKNELFLISYLGVDV